MSKDIIPIHRIAQAILVLRNQRVILDYDLAVLYSVETRALKQAVRRNPDRFPRDFMFELSEQEIDMVVSQFVTPDRRKFGGERAVKVNIAIMRTFVRLRQTLGSNRELAQKFSELERRVDKHDDEIAAILEAIRQLMAPPEKPGREIGFHVRERTGRYRVRTRA